MAGGGGRHVATSNIRHFAGHFAGMISVQHENLHCCQRFGVEALVLMCATIFCTIRVNDGQPPTSFSRIIQIPARSGGGGAAAAAAAAAAAGGTVVKGTVVVGARVMVIEAAVLLLYNVKRGNE